MLTIDSEDIIVNGYPNIIIMFVKIYKLWVRK